MARRREPSSTAVSRFFARVCATRAAWTCSSGAGFAVAVFPRLNGTAGRIQRAGAGLRGGDRHLGHEGSGAEALASVSKPLGSLAGPASIGRRTLLPGGRRSRTASRRDRHRRPPARLPRRDRRRHDPLDVRARRSRRSSGAALDPLALPGDARQRQRLRGPLDLPGRAQARARDDLRASWRPALCARALWWDVRSLFPAGMAEGLATAPALADALVAATDRDARAVLAPDPRPHRRIRLARASSPRRSRRAGRSSAW